MIPRVRSMHPQGGIGGGAVALDTLSPTLASGGVTPSRIVKTTHLQSLGIAQLVQLDCGMGRRPSAPSSGAPTDGSMSEVCSDMPSSGAGEELGERSTSFFDHRRFRGARAAQQRSSVTQSTAADTQRPSSGNDIVDAGQSILSYSRGGSFYSRDSSLSRTRSSFSSGSNDFASCNSSFTAISESVQSCSLTVLYEVTNNRSLLPNSRLRKAPIPRNNSGSFVTLFGTAVIDGVSMTSYPNTSIAQCSPLGVNLSEEKFGRASEANFTVQASCSGNAGEGSKVKRSQSVGKSAPNGGPSVSEASKNTAANGKIAVENSTAAATAANKKSVNIAAPTPNKGSGRDSEDDGADIAEAPWRVQQATKMERVGRGSYGDVYKGVDKSTGKVVAIKEILVPKDFNNDLEKQLQALEREMRVMRKLHHINTVNYLGASREDSCLNIYMEFLSGGSIGERLRSSGAFTEEVTRSYTGQLLQGLAYLHEKQIVHRDLKGDNLFLTDDDVLKVGDFGTSKELATTLVTDSVAGTPNFMAPEVISCTGHSYAADIWSVGCCVLEMLTGTPPFSKHDNLMAVMFAVMRGGLEEQVPAHISDGAKDFIRVCTQSDPKDRWSLSQLIAHSWLADKTKGKPEGSLDAGQSEATRRRLSVADALATDAGLSKEKSRQGASSGKNGKAAPLGSLKNKTSAPLDVSALVKVVTEPGPTPMAQSRSTDAGYECLTADPGVSSSNPSSQDDGSTPKKSTPKPRPAQQQPQPQPPLLPTSPRVAAPRRTPKNHNKGTGANGSKKDLTGTPVSTTAPPPDVAQQQSLASPTSPLSRSRSGVLALSSQQRGSISVSSATASGSIPSLFSRHPATTRVSRNHDNTVALQTSSSRPPNGPPPPANPRKPPGHSPKAVRRRVAPAHTSKE